MKRNLLLSLLFLDITALHLCVASAYVHWPLTWGALHNAAFCQDTTGIWCRKDTDPGGPWVSGVHPIMCCLRDREDGKLVEITNWRRCQDLYQHPVGCRAYLEHTARQPALTDIPGLTRPRIDFAMKVDLWLTTSHEYEYLLEWFLRSAQHFWPFAQWQSHVVLAMDRGMQEEALCNITRASHRRMPLRCLYMEKPAFPGPDVKGNAFFFSRGMTRGCWNSFHADLHVSGADWIAYVQPDMVFFSDLIPYTLFDWSGPVPRPVIFAAITPHFVPCVITTGLPWVGEFMDNVGFPLVFKPSHLKGLRQYMMEKFEVGTFIDAFQALMQGLHLWSWSDERQWTDTANDFICFECILGNYLYEFHRDEYFWSIRDGIRTNVPTEHTCLSLRSAAHYGGGRCKSTGTKRLGERREQIEYSSSAIQLMRSGSSGLKYPPKDDADRSLVSTLLFGWSRRKFTHCPNRTEDSLLETYAAWEASRIADGILVE